MHRQLQQMATWNRRKTILLLVLFLSIILLSLSVSHFIARNHRLELAFERLPHTPDETDASRNAWAYSGTGASILVILSVCLLLLREISLRKKIVEELKLHKEHYRITINSMAEGLITAGKHGGIVYMNPAAEKLTGWNLNDAKNLPLETVYDVVNEASGKPFENIVSRILKNRQQAGFENNTLLHTKNRNQLIISNSGVPLFDGKGNIYGAVLVFNDITDQKKIETQLKDYRFALETSSIVDISDKSGIILYANENFCRISQYTQQELLGKDHSLLSSGAHSRAFMEDLWATVSAGKVWRGEIRNRAKDGTLYWVDSTIVPFVNSNGEPFQFITIRTDITSRKESETFISGVLNSLSSHIAVINAAGTIIKTNGPWNAYAINNGASSLENCGEGANYFDVCNKAGGGEDGIAGKTMAGIKKVLSGELTEFYLEYPCHSPKEERWFYMRVMRLNSEEPLLVIEHHDMTERKRSESATLKAIERYDILAKATSDTIWDWDITANKMLYNPGITKMFGYTIAEVEDVFNWWKENIHPDDLQLVTDAYLGAIEKTTQTLQLEYRFRCADGAYKYVFDRAFVIYNNHLQPVRMIGAMQDVTYAKEEEKRIARAIIDAQEQERRYIGEELHDNVNQLLASSLLTIGMVKHYQTVPGKILEFADLTKEHTMNALNEIRKLSHELAPAAFDDNTLKDIFEQLLDSINPKGQFTINFHFDDKINQLTCQDIQTNLYRILQEQVKNILKYAEADTIDVSVTCIGNTVKMRTADNGTGFDIKNIKKGIGLSNMKRRVESFAGKLVLNTAPGHGCEMIVEIPCELPVSSIAPKEIQRKAS